METNKNIFAKSDYMVEIGYIYPIKLKDYDEFVENSTFLYYSKSHFNDEYQEVSLLQLLVFGFKDEKLVESMTKIFSLVLNKQISFFVSDEGKFGFISDDKSSVINEINYDGLRKTIMRQNLMFEQKVYKDKIVQQMMNKVFETRSKNSLKTEIEDMISTVSVFTGKHYWDLAEYTIYQLMSDFNRISKFKNYDTSVAFKCVSPSEVQIEHFAERINLLKNPYDLDNFTKSMDKVEKLNKATR